MKKELVALEPELKKKSEDTNNLMEKLVVDQEEADKVIMSHMVFTLLLFSIDEYTVCFGNTVKVLLLVGYQFFWFSWLDQTTKFCSQRIRDSH